VAAHIVGVSAFYHDSAACIVRDGDIVEQAACLPSDAVARRTADLLQWTATP
jgi:hypothetical protein